MIDIISKYQTSIFLNASDIVPSPDIISSLLGIFKDKGLLPTTFQEIGLNSPAVQVRLRLSSPNNEWGINFASNRIDIEKHPVVSGGKNMGELEAFTNDAIEFIRRILKHFNKKGNRLSLITSGLLREMRDEQLNAIYGKLFHPLPFYCEPFPFEWNYRSVTRRDMKIKNIDEKLNIITNINRIKGQIMESNRVIPLDRIEVVFDINTLAEDDSNRFSVESMKEFFEGAIALRNTIIKEIEETING